MYSTTVPFEWMFGVITAMAGVLAVSLGLNYIVLRQINPALGYMMDLAQKGEKLLKDFTTPGEGGRPPEGMIEKLLAIPGIQQAISGYVQKMAGGVQYGP